jgi:tetratricopeptide (TPR) repeat protein
VRLVIECAGKKVEFPLTEGTVILGRDKTCDITFPEPSLSRRHLMCTLRGSELVVRDLNTKNGTFLGHQRIEEARLWAGVRLRAGNAVIHLEADEGAPARPSFEFTDETAGMPVAPPAEEAAHAPDLESRVPDDAAFHEDEEATPIDELEEEPPAGEPSTAPSGANLVVHEGRWYAVDQSTGAEVEIVPVARQPDEPSSAAGAGLPAVVGGPARPEPSDLPAVWAPSEVAASVRTLEAGRAPGALARIWANPRRRLLLIAAAVLIPVLLALLVILLQPAPPPPPMPESVYWGHIAEALTAFDERGAHDEALRILDAKILARPAAKVSVERKRYARLLREALAADKRYTEAFEADTGDEVRELWEEVRDHSKSGPRTREIVDRRLTFFVNEAQALGSLNDAVRALRRGAYNESIRIAQRVFEYENTEFHEQARELIAKARRAMIEDFLSRADQAERREQWREAIGHLERAVAVDPERKAALKERIDRNTKYERHQQTLARAGKLFEAQQYADALAALEAVGEDSPYAEAAERLREKCLKQGAVQAAMAAYRSGRGERALEYLKQADQDQTGLAARIRQVMKAREEALAAMGPDTGDLHAAEAAWEAILDMESNEGNQYVIEAKTQLRKLPDLRRALAQQLVDEARRDVRSRLFQEAQRKFSQALRLDPNNTEAGEGLKQLRADAEFDLNRANNALFNGEPRTALQYLQDALARLSATDPLYDPIRRKIREVKERLGAP